MAVFQVGKLYSIPDIHNAVGGELQTYLPQKNGAIVAGRFTIQMNPECPDRVYPADKPQVRAKAELFVQQASAVPVFTKAARGDQLFEYRGRYRALRFRKDSASIKHAEQNSGRHPLAGILEMERVSN